MMFCSRIIQIPSGEASAGIGCACHTPFPSGHFTHVSTWDVGCIHSCTMPPQTSFVILLFLPSVFLASPHIIILFGDSSSKHLAPHHAPHLIAWRLCTCSFCLSTWRHNPSVSTHSIFQVRDGCGYVCLLEYETCPLAVLCSFCYFIALNGILHDMKTLLAQMTLPMWYPSPCHSPQRGHFHHTFLLIPSLWSYCY